MFCFFYFAILTAKINPLRNLSLVCATFVVSVFGSCTKEDSPKNKVPVADAGPDREIQLPDTAFLKGHGTDADGVIVGYLWSQVSGPAASTLQNPGDSGTVADFSAPGTYLFQLMVVDNDGATGLDTLSILVKSDPTDTLTLQPAKNPNSIMIWGNLNGLDLSWNQSPETGAAAWTYNGEPMFERSAFKFDLSSIPSTATIISAYLSLYSETVPLNGNLQDANFGQDAMYIKEITSDWDATTTNFAHQPSTTTTGQVSIAATTESRLDITADVKDMVSDMVTSQHNYGFMIQLQNEIYYSSRLFYSSYGTDSTKSPKLVVSYKP